MPQGRAGTEHSEGQKTGEQTRKGLADLDIIIFRLYEDFVFGELSKDGSKKMSADYEAEPERIRLEIEAFEEWVGQQQERNDAPDTFIAWSKKYVDVAELTQTIINGYIKKIIVYAPDKSGGKRTQKLKIHFNFVDNVGIPVISEPVVTETTHKSRRRRDRIGHAVFCGKIVTCRY